MPHTPLRIAFCAFFAVTFAYAQSAPPASKAGTTAENPVQLSPFEVVDDAKGYFSGNTMSGTRLNSKLEDVGAAITVMTKEQMSDFAMLDINDIFAYEAGTEGTGNFTSFDVDRNGMVSDRIQDNPPHLLYHRLSGTFQHA